MTAHHPPTVTDLPRKLGVWLVVLLLLLGFVVFRVTTTDTSIAQFSRGQDLTACRSRFSAAASAQMVVVLDTDAALDILTTNATRAAIEDGPKSQRYLDTLIPLDAAQEDRRSALTRLGVLYDAYGDAVERSLSDPEGFLTDCNKETDS